MDAISIKTDYEVLASLIKIPDLISYAKSKNLDALGIIDNNLCASAEFLKACNQNNIKPLIALDIEIDNKHLYLYAKDENSLKKLFKINTYKLDNEITKEYLAPMLKDFLVVVTDIELYKELKTHTDKIYFGYDNENTKKVGIDQKAKTVFFNIAKTLQKEDTKYLKYLTLIEDGKRPEINQMDAKENYLKPGNNLEFTSQINITLSQNSNLIPHYDEKIKDSYEYLKQLAVFGLKKRLNGVVPKNYQERLLYELKVIKDMNFVDYFLIVYDYVKYARSNDIMVGPGRGSAAGSLVTYSLGITMIDPLKYNLLFERFLNKERVTMPDIDIDFDAKERWRVINYVKEKYGDNCVMPIMTYGTFASKQVLLSIAKIWGTEIDALMPLIDAKKTLKENLTPEVIKILNSNLEIKKIYYEAFKFEGLKKHISTHAAGVVICNTALDNIIPIIKSGDTYLTGYTMNYLEALGLLKMDFLAIKDLTTMKMIIDDINEKLDLNKIDLEDESVLNEFKKVNTTGIFQFESEGMKSFLQKLKPSKFDDLVVALALYRPGPMQNIDTFIRRKEGKEKVDYITPELEDILKETYGIIVYQEQIMQIFTALAGYSYSEADIIRRAISKKKEEVIKEEQIKFITRAKNKVSEETASKIYDLIMKFANYGFNKSHSVAYAFVGYQMMYLKVKYPLYFYKDLLTINIGSATKTKEYIDEAKSLGIKIVKPDINLSTNEYIIHEESILMPFNIIKNVGGTASNDIVKEREKGPFQDFYDFVSRLYGKSVNTKTITNLIMAGVFDSFNETRNTLINSMKNASIYAELISGLDSSLVSKPELERKEEFPLNELMKAEIDLYGFYVSNHPASKFKGIKINEIPNYFDKMIEIYGLLESIKTIKTKKNDTMAFLKISDETGYFDCTIFPKKIDYINRIKEGEVLKFYGHVEKRYDKYQLIINKIDKIRNQEQKWKIINS